VVHAVIQNFNDKAVSTDIAYQQVGTTIAESSLSLQPHSRDTIQFDLASGLSELVILTRDDFLTDNVLSISNPEEKMIYAMYMRNVESPFLRTALESIKNTGIEAAEPPIVPQRDFDVFIIGEVDSELVLPGTYTDMLAQVKKGSVLIVEAQEGLETELTRHLPVNIHEKISEEAEVSVGGSEMLTDISFGSVSYYYNAQARDDAVVLASVKDDIPVVAVAEHGDGAIMYFGIPDKASDFKFSPSYPIFWNRIITNLLSIKNIRDFNLKTGKVLAIDNQDVVTPLGRVKTAKLFLDVAGFYELRDRTIAVNLLSAEESDLNGGEDTLTEQGLAGMRKEGRGLETILAVLALILIMVEFIVVKMRGDV